VYVLHVLKKQLHLTDLNISQPPLINPVEQLVRSQDPVADQK